MQLKVSIAFLIYFAHTKVNLFIFLSSLSVLHIVVDIVNAINFIKNYDSEHPEINWARGHNDVS